MIDRPEVSIKKEPKYKKLIKSFNLTTDQQKNVESFFDIFFKKLNEYQVLTTEDDTSVKVCAFSSYCIVLNKINKTILLYTYGNDDPDFISGPYSTTLSLPEMRVSDFVPFAPTAWKNVERTIQNILFSKLLSVAAQVLHTDLKQDQKKRIQKCCISYIHGKATNVMRCLRGKFFELVDKEVLSLTGKLTGRSTSLFHYNLVQSNLKEVKNLTRTTPSVVALWLGFEKMQISKGQMFFSLKYDSIVKDMQNLLTKRGFENKKYWKLCCKLPVTCAFALSDVPAFDVYPNTFMANNGDIEKLMIFFNAIIDGCCIPKPYVFRHVLYQLTEYDRINSKVLSAFFIALFAESNRKKRRVKNLYKDEVNLVRDWIRTLNENDYTQEQLKSPWSWWMRKQQEWHEDIIRNKKAAIRFCQWDSLVEETTIGEFVVVPLVDSYALYEEGQRMHHCVSTYAYRCENGTSRIFSIRRQDGEKGSTFELILRDGKWLMNQNQGPCNTKPPEPLNQMSQKVLGLYNKAWLALPDDCKASAVSKRDKLPEAIVAVAR